jgi:probable F420-dependent oxidoreductase
VTPVDPPRPFRFGLSTRGPGSSGELAETARWTEANGFSTLLMADHLVPGLLDPFPALSAAATATTTLRIGTFVLNNDLRHPVMAAREAASLDLLSDGRFELGLGAGHMRSEYDEAGIRFDRGAIRVQRLAESVQVLKTLLSGKDCTFSGEHYRIQGHRAPALAQGSGPPLLVGGNGRRLHELAAREADAVGFVGFSHRRGGREASLDDFGPEALGRQVAAVREAAGARFPRLELNALVQRAVVTDDPRAAAEDMAARDEWPDPETALRSPYLLVGSLDSIAEQLIARRERFGVSYWALFDGRGGRDLAPVVARLAGT